MAVSPNSLDWYEAFKTRSAMQATLSEAFTQNLQQAEVDQGAEYFERKCAQCHDDQKQGGHSKGPHLWNWYGRKAGSIAGFDFSGAMAESVHHWDFATLNYYLTRTDPSRNGGGNEFQRHTPR